MVEGGVFNITNQIKPTNKDLLVSFSPSTNTVNYSYTIYKNGKPINTYNVKNNNPCNINLTETGTYNIVVTSKTNTNQTITTKSIDYVIDKEAPILQAKQTDIEISSNDDSYLNQIQMTAKDNYDGNVTNKLITNDIDISTPGLKTLTYSVSDKAGNVATKDINVNVVNNFNSLFILQILVFVAIIIIIIPIMRVNRHFKITKRLDPFVIEPTKEHTVSMFDRLFNLYHSVIDKIIKVLNMSEFAKKYAKKLDKYSVVSAIHSEGMEILGGKCLIAVLLLVITVFATSLQFKIISIYEVIIPLLVGFFILDILYFIKYKLYRTKLENDLLSAIIVMNNAFKSGRSISQAIDLVGTEIEGEIGKEFKKMSLELSYGLGIDVIFKRFADRIKLEEVNYLTASLTILNKTGGNITEVFGTIEKTLFNKKKLRLELKSLTGSSKIIVWVILSVPFAFVLLVSFINPSYFEPFITTKLGIIILVAMIVYYIIFIFFVRKIMRVVI